MSERITAARADSGTCIIAKPEAVTMNSTRCSITIVNLDNTIQVEFSQALSPPLITQSQSYAHGEIKDIPYLWTKGSIEKSTKNDVVSICSSLPIR